MADETVEKWQFLACMRFRAVVYAYTKKKVHYEVHLECLQLLNRCALLGWFLPLERGKNLLREHDNTASFFYESNTDPTYSQK